VASNPERIRFLEIKPESRMKQIYRKTPFWIALSVAACAGEMVRRHVNRCRQKVADRCFEERQLETLEGEGGIILT
jgi:hypothetical protein